KAGGRAVLARAAWSLKLWRRSEPRRGLKQKVKLRCFLRFQAQVAGNDRFWSSSLQKESNVLASAHLDNGRCANRCRAGARKWRGRPSKLRIRGPPAHKSNQKRGPNTPGMIGKGIAAGVVAKVGVWGRM